MGWAWLECVELVGEYGDRSPSMPPLGVSCAASASSQLECADGEGGHGDHGHRVEHCLAHQLGVVYHLSPDGGLGHNGGRGAQPGGAIHLLVREGVGDVAHRHGLAHCHRLWVQGKLGAKVGYVVKGGRVHCDVANGGCGRCQLHSRAGG